MTFLPKMKYGGSRINGPNGSGSKSNSKTSCKKPGSQNGKEKTSRKRSRNTIKTGHRTPSPMLIEIKVLELNELKNFSRVKPFVSSREYEALVYYFYFDFTHERIAELMAITQPTVTRLIKIGLSRIKKAIEAKKLYFPIE
jgi:DNA-directed RNA polymerase specialized sigma subunit